MIRCQMSLSINLCNRVAEAYSQKYLITKSTKLNESLSFWLMNSLQELRREDPYTYDELYNMTKSSQREVLEMILEMNTMNIPGISEVIRVGAIKSLEETLSINNDLVDYPEELFNEYLEYIESNVVPILESDDSKFKLKVDKFLNKIQDKDGEKIGFRPMKHWPILASSIAVLSPLFGASLLTAFLALVCVGVSTMALATFTTSSVIKNQLELINEVAKSIIKLTKYISKAGVHYQYRYTIIYKNEEKCYARAGLDPKRLGVGAFSAVKLSSAFRTILSGATVDKIDILRNCFLQSYLDRISIFFDMYFDCLRNTGDWNNVRYMNDDKFVQMFRMHGKLYPMCDEYRELAVDAISTYEDLVDFLFKEDPQIRSKWYLLLNRYILDKKGEQDKHKDKFNKDIRKKDTFTGTRFGKKMADV